VVVHLSAVAGSGPGGALLPADVLRAIGPNGAVSLAGLSLTSTAPQPGDPAGTVRDYTLTFGSTLPAGQYVIDFKTPSPTTTATLATSSAALPFTVPAGRQLGTADVLTVTNNATGMPVFLSGAVLTGSGTSYTLTFPAALPAGTYTITVAPAALATTRVAGSGLPMDNNFNAGLDLLTGRAAAGAATTAQTFASSSNPVTIAPGTAETSSGGTAFVDPSVTDMTITVPDDFTVTQDSVNKISVLLNIAHPNDRDLTIELLPPSSTGLDPILLYNGADATPFAPGKTANFRNTLLVDQVGNPNFPSILLSQPDYFAGANGGFSPETPLSALADPNNPISAKGVWTLRVINNGTNAIPNGTSYPNGTPIQITSWQLTLPRAVAGSGLGEPTADQFTAGFKVYTLDPTNAASQTAWTPVGPSSANEGADTGRVTSVAVDPSDPSGNTVYVVGASGGVWKTTDFMTSNVSGPHYVPLTDTAPVITNTAAGASGSGLNIQSLALFPRNNDPAQTVVFALTGEGNTQGIIQGAYTQDGVGLLRSTDGGKTWVLLDSTNNLSSDPTAPPGTVAKASDPARDHVFVGASGFKVVVDPNPAPDGGVIVYMALSGAAAQAGVWRSLDGGLTWQRIRAGQATDVILAAGSANTVDPVTQKTVSNGNLQRLYAAFAGDGVYFTDSAPSANGMSLMDGQGGLPSVRDVSVGGSNGVAVAVQTAPSPNGGQGRIAIAAPALSNNPVLNSYYKNWLYAVVITPQGGLAGLYETKDAGKNWTLVKLPVYTPPNTVGVGYASNDDSLNSFDPTGLAGFGLGNFAVSVTVDPQNPAIVYLAGLGDGGIGTPSGSAPLEPAGGSIRIDLTKIKDTQNFTNFNDSDPAGGFQATTTGGLVARVNAGNGGTGRVVKGNSTATYSTDFINLSRDPANPFVTNSTVQVRNVAAVVNNGTDVSWQPFADVLGVGTLAPGKTTNEREGAEDIHQIVPFIDPTTGKVRYIFATEQGVFTGVDAGDGTLTTSLGFDQVVQGSRNGDLQLMQFYSGAVQPSQQAADAGGAMFYGMADGNGFVVSDPRAVATGNANWRGPEGDGVWVAVDQTGSGTSYQYRNPINAGLDNNTTALPNDFFRVFPPNTDPEFSGGIGRTQGLILNGDDPGTNTGEWPSDSRDIGYSFAVNPVNPNALVIQSSVGRVFRSTDQGNSWIPIGQPAQLDASGPGAQAFGSADPANSIATNNFVYVGTAAGNLFVTTTGGGTWTNISAGLDGSPIRRIVPNPAVGSKEVYALTNTGAFYKANGTDPASPWINITGNLFSITRAAFGDVDDQVNALPTAPGARALDALAVDWRFANPTAGSAGDPVTAPDLYVGGVGGVYKSSDFGATWALFPAITAGATTAGGNLPNVEVTDLDLSIGDLNPTTGQYQAGGLNLLLASTYGRGSYAIRLSDALPPQTFVAGPAVTAVINPNPAGGPSSSLQVQFSSQVDPATIKPGNFQLQPLDAGGNPVGAPVPILAVTAVTDPGVQNRYEITFQTQSGAPAQYRLTVGYDSTGAGIPSITDPSGNRMDQNGNTTNGEAVVDQFVRTVTLNGQTNSLVVTTSPSALTAGVRGAVRIEERDSSGNLLTSANTTLTISSTGPGAIQLFDVNGNPITSVPLVNGVAQFQVEMTTAGTYQVMASPPLAVTNVNPTQFTTAVTAAAAASVTLTPASSTATAPGGVTYTLNFFDQFGNPTSYTGTATVTYTGAPVGGGSPTSVPVTAAGPNTFTVTTRQTGTVGVKVTVPAPAGGGTLTSNTASITVNPGAATTVVVTPLGSGPFVVGQTITVSVQVLDASGNPVAVSGPLTVSPGSDPGAVVSPNPQITNGTGTFTVVYSTPGSYGITVTAPGGTTGSSAAVSVQAVKPKPPVNSTLTGVYAAATGVNGNPTVTIFQANGQPLTTLNPFPPGFGGEVDTGSVGFTGGIRVAVADVTGDGVPDYVIGSGPTITATVLVIDGATNKTILTLHPFDNFTGGVFVSTGDLTGDGVADIVVTPDEGGGPRVEIYKGGTGHFQQIANFFGIDDPNFRGGARAAMGDVNGDGFADLVISAGFGGGPRISIYDGAALAQGTKLNVIGDFFAFEPNLRNGAYVAVGDVNGDGLADLIFGAGPGGGPRVLVLDSSTLLSAGSAAALSTPLFNSFLGDPNNRGGVRVAAKNLDGDKFADILIGSGEGGGSTVEAFSGKDFSVLESFDLLPGYTGGVFVG
jgi:hypothetical protein